MNIENKSIENMTESTNQGMATTFFRSISSFVNGEDAKATEIKSDLSQTTNTCKMEELKEKNESCETNLIIVNIKLITLEILLVFVRCIKTILLWIGVVIYTTLGWEIKLPRSWFLNSTLYYNNQKQ